MSPERTIVVSASTVDAEKSLQRFLKRFSKLGGEVLSVVPEFSPPVQPVEYIVPERHIVTRSEFTARALETTSLGQATRAWRAAAGVKSQEKGVSKGGFSKIEIEDTNVMDLNEVLSTVRTAETGGAYTELLGKTRWNLIAGFINERFAYEPEAFVLPWHDEIHPDLRLSAAAVRHEAAIANLAELYRSYHHEPTLF